MARWLYCDIDNTLTLEDKRNAPPAMARIAKLQRLARRYTIVLWSMSGADYAAEFAKRHGIPAFACLKKPSVIVDDKAPLFRPADRLAVHPPSFLED